MPDHFTPSPVTELGLFFARFPLLCQGMALGALVLELLALLMMLGGRWTLFIGGGLSALQFGIYLTLGVGFPAMVPVFASLLPWEFLWRSSALRRWSRRGRA